MIRCTRQHWERTLARRGYTPEQVAACIVSEDGERLTVDERHPAYPRARPGLGDRVAGVLATVGITEERVSRVLGKPCGCAKRKAALNALGRRLGIG